MYHNYLQCGQTRIRQVFLANHYLPMQITFDLYRHNCFRHQVKELPLANKLIDNAAENGSSSSVT